MGWSPFETGPKLGPSNPMIFVGWSDVCVLFKGLTVLGIRKEFNTYPNKENNSANFKKKKKKAQTYFFVYIMRIISYLLYLISEN